MHTFFFNCSVVRCSVVRRSNLSFKGICHCQEFLCGLSAEPSEAFSAFIRWSSESYVGCSVSIQSHIDALTLEHSRVVHDRCSLFPLHGILHK